MIAENISLYQDQTRKKVISEKGKKQLVYMNYNDQECKNSTCPITLQDLTTNDEIVKLPCNHSFQPKAIELWLNCEKAECPVCRFQLDYIEK